MPQPFLAMITPLGDGGAPPQPPLGIWGGRPPPYVDIGGPGGPQPVPPGYWGGVAPPFPTHPIAPGGPPPGIWGGPPLYPDIGGPGPQPPSGAHPSQPIYWPPYPSQGPGFPTNPIVLPPDLPPTMPDPDNRPIEWKTAWTQTTGWVVVGVPSGPAPTPSAA
jgi:hypothetical protein